MKRIQQINSIVILFSVMFLTFFLLGTTVNAETIPPRYDLRNINGSSFVTPVKDQTDYGDCWAFSAAAAMESNLLKQGYGVQDLSEFELAYYASHTATPARPGLEKDKTVLVDYYNGTYLDAGGLSHYVTQLMANGYGVTTEDILPHPVSGKPPRSIDNLITYHDNKYTISNIDWVSMKNRAAVKSHIMKYGAADAGFEIYLDSQDNPDFYWNKETNSYYLSNTGYNIAERLGNVGGHAIAIVGWDDNYSRNLFGGKRNAKPSEDGAWLCKNSWGTGSEYCEDGYFWISYEDASLSTSSVAFYEMAPVRNQNNNIYQYDGSLSATSLKARHRKVSTANIFTCKKAELLNSVGFLQRSSNLSYTIQIYIHPKNNNPTSGKKMLVKALSGSSMYEGYHIIPLPKSISMKKGDRFAVVITFRTKTKNKIKIPTDDNMSLPYDESRDDTKYISYSKKGQSYLKDGKKWKDLSKSGHTNLRIKAYAN